MDIRYRVTDPHPVREVPEEGSLPCPRSQLGHPADILAEATRSQGPWPCPSCFPCVCPVHTEFQPRIAKEETAVEGSSLEKQ